MIIPNRKVPHHLLRKYNILSLIPAGLVVRLSCTVSARLAIESLGELTERTVDTRHTVNVPFT